MIFKKKIISSISLKIVNNICYIILKNVDVTAISLILAGLARCGAFGCFDEFNRLQEATLSVLSMIIQPIQMAIQQKSDTVTIFDEKVRTIFIFCILFVICLLGDDRYSLNNMHSLP